MPANLYRTSAFGPAIPPRVVSGGAALFANGTGTVQFDHLRVTQYPDPSASLANAGRATSSVANWNANIPSGTGLSVYTSLDDGASYQVATSASDIAGISTQLHSTLILQHKPLAYLRLDEASGITANDLSGNGNSGTLTNDGYGNPVGVTLGVTGALQGPGESTDTAMTFDGASGYITMAGPNPTGWTSLSLSCWVKLSNNSFVNYPCLICNSGTLSGFRLTLAPASDGKSCYLVVSNGTTDQSVGFGTGVLSTGVWYHIAATWDGTTIRGYINSVLSGSGSASGSIASSGNAIHLASNAGGGALFAGTMDEVAIFNSTVLSPLSASDVTALYNAGLSGVGQDITDTYTANTSANYTQTFGSGGGGATWTWDTANSRLSAVGGNKAHLLYNNLWAYDIDMLGDFYQSENSGFVWGYQDASNYYSLVLKDAQASGGANTATINKVSGGASTQLATTAITWQVVSGGVTTYHVHHRFHLTMLSGVITLSMDENQILTYTDSSPFPAGLAGLRNDTGTSYIYLLAITPQPVDVSSKFISSKHVLTTNSPTITPQITDHQAMAGDTSFGVGVLVPSADYRQTYVSDNVDDLNTKSNYWWQVSPNKNIVFQPRNAKNSPWILQSTDVLAGTLPTVEYSGDLYRNKQTLKGVYDSASFGQIFNGDGQTRTWNVANPVVAVPTIVLNGITATVGEQGKDTGKQFYYAFNDVAITQDDSQTILQSTDVLKITYTGSFGIDFSIDNTGQFSNTISQSQLAAIDGTDGIIEAVEDVSSQNMNVAAATAYANSLLQRYGSIARTVKFQTLHSGLKPGHNLPVFVPQLNIFDSTFLVIEVNTSIRTIAGGNIQYVYDCTISELAALSSWVKAFSKLLRSVSGSHAKV